MNPKVSIIVPNYNHARFLKQRLDSVFNQTYQDFEVILLDDASTDTSREVLNSYKEHPKVSHLVFNETNSGSPFKQWEKGIGLAQGEYIWIAESDDYCELNFLEVLLKKFDNNHVVLTYCASYLVDDGSKVLDRHKWAYALDNKRWESDFVNLGNKEIKCFLGYRNTITNASAVVFKKDAVLNIKMPIDMMFCGDWYIWIAILKQGGIAYSAMPLNYFRRHYASTKTKKTLKVEIHRVNEYFAIILNNTHFFKRTLNIKKYDWIFMEWHTKTNKKLHEDIRLPFEFWLYSKLRFNR